MSRSRGKPRGGSRSPAPSGVGPVRTCVSCRRRAAAGELVRLWDDGERIRTGPRPGSRGAWLCWAARCIERADKAPGLLRHALRSARSPARGEVEAALAEAVRSGLDAALLQSWRSGLLRTGRPPGVVEMILLAEDAPPSEEPGDPGRVEVLPHLASELGALLARPPLQRLYLGVGGPTKTVSRWLRRRALLG